MRAALLRAYGGTVELGERPRSGAGTGRDARPRSARRPSSRSTCCAPAVRRTSAGNRCRTSPACRASESSGPRPTYPPAGGSGSRPRPAWTRSTAAWPSNARSGTRTWCRSPTRSPTPRWPRSAPPGSRPGCRSPGAPDCSRRTGGRARRQRRGRPGGAGRGQASAARPAWSRSAGRNAQPAGSGGRSRREVVVLNPDEDRAELTARLIEAAGGPVDVVIDPVFGEPAAAAAMALAPWGRLVNIGGAAGDVAEFSSAVLRGRTIGILGYTNNAISPEQRAEALTAGARPRRPGRRVRRAPGAAARRVRPGLGRWPASPDPGSSSPSDPDRDALTESNSPGGASVLHCPC